MLKLDKDFWSERYDNNILGWDAGAITTPLKEYIDQLKRKDIEILIPGCGQGHEARYLYDNGFTHVTIVDLVKKPIEELRQYCSNWPDDHFIVSNFFDIKGQFDLIVEQTFFCALNPELRQQYADKMYELLKPGGKLVGLLFNIDLPGDGPPFGGHRSEYLEYFKLFNIRTFETAYNSIKPRQGNELFINMVKPG